MITIKQADTGRNNNFDLLRFVAAAMVIFSHSFLVTGCFNNEPLHKLSGFLDLGALGVKIFFTISGYLITKSLYRQPTLNSFIRARFLRIFPGLLATAIFCALIIGPACTVLPLHKYFACPAVYNFIWQLATLHNFGNNLPGVFELNPYKSQVNSPIWTLPAELMMYLCVLLSGILSLLWKKQFKSLLITLPALILAAVFFGGISFNSLYMSYVYSWGILFLTGALFYLFRDKIMISIKLFAGFLIIFLLLFHFRWPLIDYIFDALLAYGIFIAAYHPKLQVNTFRKTGDFSYGLYIYAFPVQQLLADKFQAIKPAAHFMLSFVLALMLAVLSWYFVEKPILKFKSTGLLRHS